MAGAGFNPFVSNKTNGYAWHNLSKDIATAINVGPVVPIYHRIVRFGDKWRIRPSLRIKTLPFSTAMMSGFRVQLDTYFCPDTNLYGFMANNERTSAQEWENMPRWWFGVLSHTPSGASESAYSDFVSHIGSGSLMNYLYGPVGFSPLSFQRTLGFSPEPDPEAIDYSSINPEQSDGTKFCADALFHYVDIVRNYYVNNMLDEIPFLVGRNLSLLNRDWSGTYVTPYGSQAVSLDVLDCITARLRYFSSSIGPNNPDLQDYRLSNQRWLGETAVFSGDVHPVGMAAAPLFGVLINGAAVQNISSQTGLGYSSPDSGLFLRAMRPDAFTRLIEGSTASAYKVTVVGDNYDDIVLASKRYAFINAIDATGGRWSDQIRFRWGVDVDRHLDRPILLSTQSAYFGVDEIISTNNGEGNQVGQMYGYVDTGKKFRGISFNAKCSGMVMMCVSIVPNLRYSEGLHWDSTAVKEMDYFQPEYTHLSYQDVPQYMLYAYPNFRGRAAYEGDTSQFNIDWSSLVGVEPDASTLNQVVGRQVAWWTYMTDVDTCYADVTPVSLGTLRQFGDADDTSLRDLYFLFFPSETGVFTYSFDRFVTVIQSQPGRSLSYESFREFESNGSPLSYVVANRHFKDYLDGGLSSVQMDNLGLSDWFNHKTWQVISPNFQAENESYFSRFGYSPWIDPAIFNRPFVNQDPFAHNFILNLGLDIKVCRQIPKNTTPKL